MNNKTQKHPNTFVKVSFTKTNKIRAQITVTNEKSHVVSKNTVTVGGVIWNQDYRDDKQLGKKILKAVEGLQSRLEREVRIIKSELS